MKRIEVELALAAIFGCACFQVLADEPFTRVSSANLSAVSTMSGTAATPLQIDGRPQQGTYTLRAADGFSYSTLDVATPAVTAGTTAAPMVGYMGSSDATLVYYLEFSDKPGTSEIQYNVTGAFKQTLSVTRVDPQGMGTETITARSNVSVSTYDSVNFSTAYAFDVFSRYSVYAFNDNFAQQTTYALTGGPGASSIQSIAFDTGTSGTLTTPQEQPYSVSQHVAPSPRIDNNQSFSAIATVKLNASGFGFLKVTISVSAAGGYSDGAMQGILTDSVYADPYFYIDPEYLATHPDASVTVLDGYGNTATPVPEPSTVALLGAGLFILLRLSRNGVHRFTRQPKGLAERVDDVAVLKFFYDA